MSDFDKREVALLKRVEEIDKQWQERLAPFWKGHAPGMHTLTDIEHAVWFQGMVAKSPPVPMLFEDGMQTVASPWLMMLAYVEGGRKELNRYERTMEKLEEGTLKLPAVSNA